MRKWLPSLRSALRAACGRRSPCGRLWLRRHGPRGRVNALKRLGIKGRALGMAYCGLGAWALARHVTIQQALKTATLN